MARIVTFGEALLRLGTPGFERFDQARSFDLEIGGAELNTAVGLVRLGHEAAWISRLPDHPLGRRVHSFVRSHGIDDRHILFGDGRQGLYFLETGAAPRASSIIYDRADSATARLKPGDFDWPAIFAGIDWFHVTGITAALSSNAAEAVKDAILAARNANARISIDLNYRAKLWSPEQAGRTMSHVIKDCDVLFASENDAKLLFGIDGDFAEMAKQFSARFGVKAVATTRREATSLWRDRLHAIGWQNGQTIETTAMDVEVVDRIGSGDAFAAGVIDGLLADDFAAGLHTGLAFAAIKHSIRGDLPLAAKDEVQSLLRGDGLRIRR
jgi:2-dehydro-3-deoxygluconokinase